MDCSSAPSLPPPTRRQRLCQLLLHRRLPIILALLAVALALPALTVGWQFDDDFHRIMIRGSQRCSAFTGSAWEMFQFLDGDPKRTMYLADYGVLPWWVVPEIKGSFWRPLTVATHWLDYRLWPNSSVLMHVHSLLWFGLVIASAALLYRRMMGPTLAAGLAALLYAVDDSHAMPAAWLANRNALVAGLFGILAIITYDRWRRDGRSGSAILSMLCTAASLLSAEAGVAVFAYLGAHAVCLDRARWPRKAAALLPFVAILIVWRILWTLGGHGIVNVGLYIDPIDQPGHFALAVFQRVPLLMLGQWALPPAETSIFFGTVPVAALVIAGYALIFGLGFLLRPLLRADPIARFWAVGMILSLIPNCATFPANRLLLFAGIGAMGLLAQLLTNVFRLVDSALPVLSENRRLRIVGWAFVVLHLVLAPISLSLFAWAPIGPEAFTDQVKVQTPLDPSVEHQDLIIVNAPSIGYAHYMPIIWELDGRPVPRHTRVLAPGVPPVTLRRLDDRTLSVRPEATFICWRFDHLFRSERNPMHVGQRVELTGLSIEVTKVTPDGRAAEAVFRFAVPLEDPSLRWLQWKDGEFIPFTPPTVGQTVEFEEADLDFW
jgi:hypothetical protein